MAEHKPIALLILGLGNVLCGDDGLGAVAVNALLDRYDMPEGVCAVDGGTLGLSLLPYIEDARQVVLIDAVRADGAAGSVVRLEGSEIAPAVRDRLSPHQVGVADLLDGAHWLDRFPERLVLLGLVPETLELGLARSPAVEARLDELIECVVDEVRSLGYELVPRGGDEASLSRVAGSAARLFGL